MISVLIKLKPSQSFVLLFVRSGFGEIFSSHLRVLGTFRRPPHSPLLSAVKSFDRRNTLHFFICNFHPMLGYPVSGTKEIFACEIRNVVNFSFVKSAILGFGIWNTAQGIRNPTKDWNPESKFHKKDWNTVPETRNPRRGIPLRGVMDSLTCMGR